MDRQRTLLIVLLLIVLGGGYYYLQVREVSSTAEGSNPAIAELDVRLNDIRPLASVELDMSVFNHPFFRSLKVVSATTGQAVLAGRPNPFLPY